MALSNISSEFSFVSSDFSLAVNDTLNSLYSVSLAKLLHVDFFHTQTSSSERLNDTCSFERLDVNG